MSAYCPPGTGQLNSICPGGNSCPNASVALGCPAGTVCPSGTNQTLSCYRSISATAEQRCPANSSVEPIIWDNTIGAVVIAAIWLILLELVSCWYDWRKQRAGVDPAPSLGRGAAAMRLNAVSDAASECPKRPLQPPPGEAAVVEKSDEYSRERRASSTSGQLDEPGMSMGNQLFPHTSDFLRLVLDGVSFQIGKAKVLSNLSLEVREAFLLVAFSLATPKRTYRPVV